MTQQVSVAQFIQIMRQGVVAHANGDRARAHRIWRRAAMLRPGEEQVWLALLTVIDNDEDRIVCLQNIITINPQNERAQRQLSVLTAPAKTPERASPARVPSVLHGMRRALSLLLVVAVGVLLGVALQIVIATDWLHL